MRESTAKPGIRFITLHQGSSAQVIYIYIYTYTYIHTHMHVRIYERVDSENRKTHTHAHSCECVMRYGVASISGLLTIIGLFCKRALSKRLYSA